MSGIYWLRPLLASLLAAGLVMALGYRYGRRIVSTALRAWDARIYRGTCLQIAARHQGSIVYAGHDPVGVVAQVGSARHGLAYRAWSRSGRDLGRFGTRRHAVDAVHLHYGRAMVRSGRWV